MVTIASANSDGAQEEFGQPYVQIAAISSMWPSEVRNLPDLPGYFVTGLAVKLAPID